MKPLLAEWRERNNLEADPLAAYRAAGVALPPTRMVTEVQDAADLRRNIDHLIPCGELTHPELASAAERSIERLHALDHQPDTEVWPGHDPDFWATRRGPPAAYG